jgi:hypothetical protein
MRSIRTKLLVAGVGAVALVLTSVGGAYATFGPGEAFGFVWTEYGAVTAQESVDLVAKKGKSLVTQRYIIPAGFNGLWPTHQGANYIMHIRGGALKGYENCADEGRDFVPGAGYFRDGAAAPLGMRLENVGSDDAELIVVWLDVNPADPHNSLPWGSEELVNGACVPRATQPVYENGNVGFDHYEYARGPAHTDIPWSHEQGLAVIAMRFLTAPQWHFNWHTHPPTFITHLRGTGFREYIGCDITLTWEPNVNYLHSPGAYSRPQERARNIDYDDNAEFMTMFTKAPKQRTRGQIPVEFTAPPDGCMTDGTVTRTD